MHLPYSSLPPLPTSLQDGLLSALQTAFRYHAEDWLPLRLNGLALGFVNEVWRKHLIRDWPNLLHEDSDGLHLFTDNWIEMGRQLEQLARRWYDAGLFGGWRNERFDVWSGDGRQILFALERSAFRPLGLYSHAVHINGLAVTEEGLRFWIARRSPHKAVDPNKLDTLVGGGISAGEQIWEAAKREGREEAGLTDAVLNHLQYTGCCISLHQVSRGLHRECLHIFDVILPNELMPQNQDGEVASFALMSAEEAALAMCNGEMMNDSVLVTADLFHRLGMLDCGHPLAAYLQAARHSTDLIGRPSENMFGPDSAK